MKILHLYPNLMNLYGDYANVTLLCRHLKDQGIPVVIDRKEVEDTINLMQYDFIYMGSGTEEKQLVALKDLIRYQQYLSLYFESGKTALFTGNAMELLGTSIDGNKALGILDFTVETQEKRYTGDVIVKNSSIGEVVGFINKSTLIHGGEEYRLFDYEFKEASLADNSYEGYHYKNLYGTHIIGPVLVKNPEFMKEIVRMFCTEVYQDIPYPYEEEAYRTTLRELKKRK
ncbi:MAG: hypothetical protein IIY56_02865 [Erysipelotrichaceae bacterium]|nr:hypothetical protein [Erysipelotrichaceae bacterium]